MALNLSLDRRNGTNYIIYPAKCRTRSALLTKANGNQTRTQMISGTGFFEISLLSFYLLLVSIQQ
jgi:hypothetical protein